MFAKSFVSKVVKLVWIFQLPIKAQNHQPEVKSNSYSILEQSFKKKQ